MALIKWEPRRTGLDPFRSLRGEVDRLFEDAFRGWPKPWAFGWPAASLDSFVPAVNLKETETQFIVTAEVPGFSKEKLDVTVTQEGVTIKGERTDESERTEEGYYFRESSSGSFQRAIPLPGAVMPDQATAKLEDGVLTLTLPKAKPSRAKGVKIDVG